MMTTDKAMPVQRQLKAVRLRTTCSTYSLQHACLLLRALNALSTTTILIIILVVGATHVPVALPHRLKIGITHDHLLHISPSIGLRSACRKRLHECCSTIRIDLARLRKLNFEVNEELGSQLPQNGISQEAMRRDNIAPQWKCKHRIPEEHAECPDNAKHRAWDDVRKTKH